MKTIRSQNPMKMRIRNKKAYLAILAILVLTAVLAIFLQSRVKHRVAAFLKTQTPSHVSLEYSGLDVNMFSGNVSMSDIAIAVFNRDTLIPYSDLRVDRLELLGLNYWAYFFNRTVHFRDVRITHPVLHYHTDRVMQRKDSARQSDIVLKKAVRLDKIELFNGEIEISRDPDSTLLQVKKLHLSILEPRTDAALLKKMIPFEFKSFRISAEGIRTEISPYETLGIRSFHVEEDRLLCREITLEPRYGKRELSRILKEERDHIDLRIPEFRIDSMDFGETGGRFYLVAGHAALVQPQLGIYRDKLVADDPSVKKLYSRQLRELPFDLNIHGLRINDGMVEYEEKVNPESQAGRIYFEELDILVNNLGNSYPPDEETEVEVRTLFMGTAPLKLKWNFNTHDSTDTFLAEGSLRNFEGSSADTFLAPNLRIRTEGKVNALYFTFSANEQRSVGELKMNYEDFKFELLDDEGDKVKKLLTAIGNLFVDDGSDTDADGFRHGAIEAERARNKSFFNYLWISVHDGVIGTLTGRGERKEKN